MKADGTTTHRALRGKVCPYFFFLWARRKKGNERSTMAMEIAAQNGREGCGDPDGYSIHFT